MVKSGFMWLKVVHAVKSGLMWLIMVESGLCG